MNRTNSQFDNFVEGFMTAWIYTKNVIMFILPFAIIKISLHIAHTISLPHIEEDLMTENPGSITFNVILIFLVFGVLGCKRAARKVEEYKRRRSFR